MVVSSFSVNENEINKSQQKTNTNFEKSSIEKAEKKQHTRTSKTGKVFVAGKGAGKVLNQMAEQKQKEKPENYYDGKNELIELLELQEVDQEDIDFIEKQIDKVVSSADGDINIKWKDGWSQHFTAGGAGLNDEDIRVMVQSAIESKYRDEEDIDLPDPNQSSLLGGTADGVAHVIENIDDRKVRKDTFQSFKNDVEDTIREKEDKIESLQSGIENLKINLESKLSVNNNLISHIDQSIEEFSKEKQLKMQNDRDRIEYESKGIEMALMLIDDGLKHLL